MANAKTFDPVQYIAEPGPDGDLWGWAGAGWYFWDETGSQGYGPYEDEATARRALRRYSESLDALCRGDSRGIYIHLTERNDDNQA